VPACFKEKWKNKEIAAKQYRISYLVKRESRVEGKE